MGSKYSLVLLLLGMIMLTTVVGERNSNNFRHSPMLDPEDDWPEIFHEQLPSNYKISKRSHQITRQTCQMKPSTTSFEPVHIAKISYHYK
ncbi:hypothetical protein MtrunA17_Chr7g0236241 [Medicago truncatula]|uniref:Leguminosin group567 LEED...PEED secreted peptide n=1 Tax=Medicago truncatula TaxID=3880 RepID=A0A072TYV4_MEDTR|nr:leguminosin group567 LEED...PEED secreted peptide [Medicago truncatula]RHN45879.1 hypothetical protein MtrunA17_Chr7g0236241 [Medicago truncatula]